MSKTHDQELEVQAYYLELWKEIPKEIDQSIKSGCLWRTKPRNWSLFYKPVVLIILKLFALDILIKIGIIYK